MIDIRPAIVPDEVPAVRDLFREYAAALGINLCFQNFDEELAGLPGAYSPPGGRLLVAPDGSTLAACVALRTLGPSTCEMKRLYVRPAYRKLGLGRRLAERILADAAAAGYREIKLDTLPVMADAIRLYRALGFTETEPYYVNPVPGALFLRKPLGP
ncbi:MAG TPA: GNAT family N-acetyltransferase [Gemmataceae bacterium]|nr:GNAT family N-acetyltransferase [Gemmataceae bacterium]